MAEMDLPARTSGDHSQKPASFADARATHLLTQRHAEGQSASAGQFVTWQVATNRVDTESQEASFNSTSALRKALQLGSLRLF
jgi:hypothetical protein